MLLYYYYFLFEKVATHHQNFDRDGNRWAKANWSCSRRNHSCGDTSAHKKLNMGSRLWDWTRKAGEQQVTAKIQRGHGIDGTVESDFFLKQRRDQTRTLQSNGGIKSQTKTEGERCYKQEKHDRAYAGRSEGEPESLGARESTNGKRCYICAFY